MKVSLENELAVLVAARDQIKKGYTKDAYMREMGPTAHVVTCAIGGVEYALYKQSGKLDYDELRGYFDNSQGKYEDSPLGKQTTKRHTLYVNTLTRLNKLARKEGYPSGIEHPNTTLDEDESKPIVLGIYNKAIRQVRDEIRRRK